MSLFAIADLHLPLGADKPMDIFPGWNDYVSRLEKNWNLIVKPTDTVVIAGDISWAMELKDTYKDFEFIHSLPGRKILLKGNHDYWWGTKKKLEDYIKSKNFNSIEIVFNNAIAVDNVAVCGTRGWFYDSKSEQDVKILNREAGRLQLSIDEAKKTGLEPVVFLHYPPVYGDIECREILEILLKNNIKKCYYGHIHGCSATKKIAQGEYKGINLQLVSCDYLKFIPKLVLKS